MGRLRLSYVLELALTLQHYLIPNFNVYQPEIFYKEFVHLGCTLEAHHWVTV
jgi:hypothetical protein